MGNKHIGSNQQINNPSQSTRCLGALDYDFEIRHEAVLLHANANEQCQSQEAGDAVGPVVAALQATTPSNGVSTLQSSESASDSLQTTVTADNDNGWKFIADGSSAPPARPELGSCPLLGLRLAGDGPAIPYCCWGMKP